EYSSPVIRSRTAATEGSLISPRPQIMEKTKGKDLMTRIYMVGWAALVSVNMASAQSVEASANQQPRLMDRQREIALALSACPALVANGAAVYVLEKSGYVKVRDSQNGFTAYRSGPEHRIVQHSIPTSQEPRCMDAEGSRTHLPRIKK